MIYAQLTRTELIDCLADLFGYSEDDFEGMNKNDIWSYLQVEQQVKVCEYIAAN